MNDDILLPHEPARNRTITIEDRYWNIARQLGQGNASRGIRAALYKAAHSDTHGQQPTGTVKHDAQPNDV